MKAYQLKVMIKNSHPPIWRRIIVPAGLSFAQLSLVLNEAMGWMSAHLYAFEFPQLELRIEETQEEDFFEMDMDVDSAEEMMLEAYLDQEDRFTYVYDFGDDWRHAVTVEKILDDYDKNYPMVIKYKGDCPPEDCGGIYGYYQLKEILSDPFHPEYAQMRQWAGDPKDCAYDLQRVNERLQSMYLSKRKGKPMGQFEIYQDLKKNHKGFRSIQGNFEGIYGSGGEDFFEDMDIDIDEEMLEQMQRKVEDMIAQFTDLKRMEFLERSEITLRDIFEDYDKASLVDIAKLHHLKRYSKLKKAELIDFLVERLLDPEVMGAYFMYLSDDELDLMEKFSDQECMYEMSEREIDLALPLIEGGYAGSNGWKFLMIPKDVYQAYKRNCKDKEWKQLRRKTLELAAYLNGGAELYGICPVEKVLQLYSKYTGKHVDENTIEDFCSMIPESKKMFFYQGENLVHKSLFDKADQEELMQAQRGKDFYLPSKIEIEMLGNKGYLPFDDSMNALLKCLQNFLMGDREFAEDLCIFIQEIFRRGAEVDDAMSFLEENDILDMIYDKSAIARLQDLLVKVWHRTRKMRERGVLPNGMTRAERKSAERQSATVVRFPVDVNKKIYPNDLCPCGSGKKYKHCCGRNQ